MVAANQPRTIAREGFRQSSTNGEQSTVRRRVLVLRPITSAEGNGEQPGGWACRQQQRKIKGMNTKYAYVRPWARRGRHGELAAAIKGQRPKALLMKLGGNGSPFSTAYTPSPEPTAVRDSVVMCGAITEPSHDHSRNRVRRSAYLPQTNWGVTPEPGQRFD